MSGLPILSLTMLIPLVGCLFIFLARRGVVDYQQHAMSVGILTSFTTLLSAIIILLAFDHDLGGFQLTESYNWISQLELAFHIGVDGTSVVFIMLTTFLMPFALIASWGSITNRISEFVMLFLILESMLIGVFVAMDIVLFYVFFEAVLIPMFLIIGIWGGDNKIYASMKFFLYTLFGSVLMLVAVLIMLITAETSFIPDLQRFEFAFNLQIFLWLAFFASFAVKVPMWPFHTWLPDAHVQAPTAGSMILAGVLLKLGGYGFLRFSLPMLPEASEFFTPLVYTLSVIAIIYGSMVAFVQDDMKKIVAYSSVAHMGFVTLGLFSFSDEGIQGAVFQMVSHGLISAALFFCVGVIYDQHKTRSLKEINGVVKYMPIYAGFLGFFVFGSVGLPGTSGFVGEIIVLLSVFKISPITAFFATTGMILGAIYMLNMFKRVALGKTTKAVERVKPVDLTFYQKIVVWPLAASILFFGIYPAPVFRLTESATADVSMAYFKKYLSRYAAVNPTDSLTDEDKD